MNIFTKIFVAIFLLFFSGAVFAQDWVEWQWETYSIGFQTPPDFQEKTNTEKELILQGKSITMKVLPWKDAAITEEDAAQKGFDTMTDVSNKQILDEGNVPEMAAGGFKAYYKFGSGKQDKKDIYFGVIGVINPDSDVNFFIRFKWWDAKDKNEKNLETCIKIVESFYAMVAG